MEDRESMFLLSIGSCLFCFVLLFCIIGMFSLEQRSDRFACKPIIKDLIFLKLGVPSVVVQTPLYNAAPSCVELCFVPMPWCSSQAVPVLCCMTLTQFISQSQFSHSVNKENSNLAQVENLTSTWNSACHNNTRYQKTYSFWER